MEKSFCFRCNTGANCACSSEEEGKKIVDHALKVLSRQNFSPPFNRINATLYIGDLRSCFDPPKECTHVRFSSLFFCSLYPSKQVVSLVDFEFSPHDGRERLIVHMEDKSSWSMREVMDQVLPFVGDSCVLVHCVEVCMINFLLINLIVIVYFSFSIFVKKNIYI